MIETIAKLKKMDSAKWKIIKETFSRVVEFPAPERDVHLKDVETEVRLEVEKLLAAHFQADDFIDQPLLIEQGIAEDAPKDNFVGTQIDSYLVLEKIGTGGMGAVYLAERLNSDFKQKVALKIIKRGMDSEAILKRFATERQILSSLKHPNIAQLIDGGISSDGLSYFVMEYVDGEPLHEFCRVKNIPLEERLEIFRLICAAVDHAHKNLVIHRDLKPTNILVTGDKIPKLLDFGIAKLLASDESATTATVTMGRIFTPEYASPEQIRGETVSTSTDVYSLGIILYELLTETRPFNVKGKSYDEIVKCICETEPPKPSETRQNIHATLEVEAPTVQIPKTRLRGDLDNIILKALRKEPSERYGSVQQFSEDISRFLSGLPVLARPQTLNYRFGKYVQRHRVGVLAAALILLSLIGGISLSTWQAVVARKERNKAQQRFDDVRKLANSVLFEYQDSLEKLSGSTTLREKMVADALEYLDKLAAESIKDDSLQLELSDAYERIGDLQGGLNKSNLGQREAAEESYLKAFEIRQELVNRFPENNQFCQKLAASFSNLGDVSWVKTNVSEALEYHKNAFELSQKLFVESPDDNELRVNVGRTQSTYARMLGANGHLEQSLENAHLATKLLEEANSKDPENKRTLRELGISYDRISEILLSLTDKYEESLEYAIKSNEVFLKIVADDRSSPVNRRSIAVGFLNISEIQGKLGKFKLALENGEQSLLMFKELLREDEQNEEFRGIVAVIDSKVSDLMIKTGNASQAIERLKNSLSVCEQLIAKSPADEILEFRLANIFESLGNAFGAIARQDQYSSKTIDLSASCSYFRKSYDIYKRFKDAGKTVGDDAAKVDIVAAELAKCETQLHK